MKKLFMTMAAVSALSVGAPATAQYAGGNVHARIQQLEFQVQAGVRSGAISRREALPLREHIRQLTLLERRYGYGGFTGRETADLQQRTNMVRQQIRYAERAGVDNRYADRTGVDNRYDRNRDGYDDRFDRNRDGDDDRFDRDNDGDDDRFDRNNDNRDDRFDRNADGDDDRFDRNNDGIDDRYDTNRDGWDDRDANRDGRWDVASRYDANRDGWDDRDLNRSGRWDDDVARGPSGAILGVGARAPEGLTSLSREYRSRYRDSDAIVYRTDGRAVYQIDVRTQSVVRVFPLNS